MDKRRRERHEGMVNAARKCGGCGGTGSRLEDAERIRITGVYTMSHPCDDLSEYEKGILALAARGLSNQSIAWEVGRSRDAVESALGRIYGKILGPEREGRESIRVRAVLMWLDYMGWKVEGP